MHALMSLFPRCLLATHNNCSRAEISILVLILNKQVFKVTIIYYTNLLMKLIRSSTIRFSDKYDYEFNISSEIHTLNIIICINFDSFTV